MTRVLKLRLLIGGAVVVAFALGARSQVGPDGRRPTGPVDAASCRECHTEVAATDVVHGPVAVNACAACHVVDSAEAHTFRIAREGAALCTYCHDLDLAGQVVHEPLETGDCIACHNPHGGTTPALLKAPTVDQLCSSCHGDMVAGKRHVHGPAAVGACTACHLPHSAPEPGLLAGTGAAVCTTCHVEMQTIIETRRVVHQPIRTDCQVCHDPHASDQDMLLREEPEALCLSCHDTVRHAVEDSKTTHAAVTTERKCLNCHDPHGSDHERLMLSDMQTLCFECHDRVIKMPDGRSLMDMKTLIESGTSLHGPVAQDNCAACHMIHGGDNFRLLVREYPAEFYAPFAEESYALCFSCHDKQLVYDARTTTLTGFRNGDLNLHFLHVNREKKGRTCRACHETHASKKQKHIRESVPFGSGGWELPIGYEKTDSGGSCAPGCHKPFGYDRVNPVEYPAPQGGIWPKG